MGKIVAVRTTLLTGPCTFDPFLLPCRALRSAGFIEIEVDEAGCAPGVIHSYKATHAAARRHGPCGPMHGTITAVHAPTSSTVHTWRSFAIATGADCGRRHWH